MDYHFEMDKFWRKLKHLNLGTGTLAARAGVRPDDLQKLIALEKAPADVAHKILDVLGREVLAYDPDESDEDVGEGEEESTTNAVAESTNKRLTVNEIKELIANGSLTLSEALDQEEKSESPRSTLLAWLSDAMNKPGATTTTEGD